MRNNKTLMIVSLAVGGGIIVLLFMGLVTGIAYNMVNKDEAVTQTQTAKEYRGDQQIPSPLDKYDDELPNAKEIFTEACGNSYDCGCVYDWLDENLTNDEFARIISEAEYKVPEELNKAIKYCI